MLNLPHAKKNHEIMNGKFIVNIAVGLFGVVMFCFGASSGIKISGGVTIGLVFVMAIFAILSSINLEKKKENTDN